MARIIDAKIAVENESKIAPLDRSKAIFKTKAFTTKENKPKVKIVSGNDNNFKIGFIIVFTKTNNNAVIKRDLVSVKEKPVNKISII